MTRESTRTVTVEVDARAQTNQDFVIGIGVFILAVAFVFTMVPDIVGIYTGTTDSGDIAQVDRVANAIVEDETLETDTPNQLDGEAFNDTYADGGLDNASLGLRAGNDYRFDQINVTIEPMERDGGQPQPLNLSDDSDPLAAGNDYDNQSGVTATRIVTVADAEDSYEEYEPGEPARLVVRMW